MGEMRNAYKTLVGKPQSKRPLGRPRHGWEDNIKMNLREIECELDSSGSRWGLVLDSCEHGNEPSGSIKDKAFAVVYYLDFIHRPYVLLPQCFEGWFFPHHQVNLLCWVWSIELASIQIIYRSNTAPSSKTFRDEQGI
jgi:hypothetical protein